MQAVEFFDLCFADRTTGGEVDVFERRPQRELGGLDAVASFALLAIIGLGLQQRVEELAVTGLIAGRISAIRFLAIAVLIGSVPPGLSK